MSNKLIDINELSKRISLRPATIRNNLHMGTFPLLPVKQGRNIFWRESDVEDYINNLKPVER
ncbi:MAG: AlpA family transcriptional regulator [Deltaproteobacteria bacterium]|nr:AlpA family transcriptional regulator [Deltaproteobacteria bacterium]